MKRLFKYVLTGTLLLLLAGCGGKKSSTNNTTATPTTTADKSINDKDIVIINTTDVHCSVNPYVDSKDATKNRMGYTNVVEYKNELKANNYVSLVDSGDFLQGDLVGAITQGEDIIKIMNKAGYDVATLGNHEFDYGMDLLKERISEFNGDILSCNIKYIGENENKLSEVKPYSIKQYGKIKVGYVGITTPETPTSSNPLVFKENDTLVYTFNCGSALNFYSEIQKNINNCKNDGADYVILLSHTGTNDENKPYTTFDILEHTTGYIAIMDGHAHNDMPYSTLKDMNNNDVYVCDNGTKLSEFSTLTITKYGEIKAQTVKNYTKTNTEFDSFINTINANIEELKNRVLTTIDIDLSISDSDNHRLVRSRETAIGNLIADAYRTIAKADIGIINGGGIRADLKSGEVTYGNMMTIHPFGNAIMTKEVSGSEILDFLEFASRTTQSIYYDGTKMVGENGSFANVSGLKYTIDTTIESTVLVDDTGNFIEVSGTRRVKDVKVLENGVYVDIDPDKKYVLASIDYILNAGGDGANMFIKDEIVPNIQMLDYEVVINYIVDELGGVLATKYSATEGRITILS